MLQLPLIAATMPACHAQLQLCATNSGDELSLRHLTVATQRRCRITGTSITMKELQLRHLQGVQQRLNHARLSYNNGHGKQLHNRGIDHQATCCN